MTAIWINDQSLQVNTEATVLEAARSHDIPIPTLCYHPALRPSGACKLCAVEIVVDSGPPLTMLACILRVKEGMRIRTEGDRVNQARAKAFERLLQMAPQSRRIREMANAHGIPLGPPPDGCVRCRLCIRVCKQIVEASALKMEKRDGQNYVVPHTGRCIGCGTCVNICPTRAIRIEDRGNVRTITIRDEIIGQHPLERCEGCGRMYITPRFLEHTQTRTAPHPHLKASHRYCPNCAKLFSDRVRAFSGRKQQLPGHR